MLARIFRAVGGLSAIRPDLIEFSPETWSSDLAAALSCDYVETFCIPGTPYRVVCDEAGLMRHPIPAVNMLGTLLYAALCLDPQLKHPVVGDIAILDFEELEKALGGENADS